MEPVNLHVDGTDHSEGVILETDVIALNLSDDDVARAIGNRVDFSRSWWNKKENLDTVQKRAENVWLNLTSADIDLYDYEEPYYENRIFVAIETLISQVLGRPPQPMVTEESDSDASRDLARNLEKVLLSLYHGNYQRAMLEMIARHLLTGFRYGIVKYRWDTSIGRLKKDGSRTGGIVTEVVRPDKVVFDAGATVKDDVPLIAEYMEASSEDLCYKYHDKQNEIMLEVGKSYGTSTHLTDLVKYLEVHFTGYHPTTGAEYEGVAWKLNQIVLDKMKNPNYNYDEYTEEVNEDKTKLKYLNYFEKPKKPYVIFNFLNQGKYIVDSTSLTEQAYQLQRQLEKRGRQIDLNADMANTGTVYNSLMVSEENVAKLIGDPDEKLMAKGDVTKAAARLPINRLEPWVINDKSDLRAAIDTIFGANAPIRGDKSGNDTLGQDELSVQRNTSRLGVLSTALENGMDKVYRAEIQLMKVFFTEEDMVKYDGPEGKTEFIKFSNMSIETGIGFRVQEGSLLPDDPATKLQEAKQFAPLMDPLTFAEYLGVDNPKLVATRLFMMKADASAYGQKYLGINPQGEHDPDAVNAIQQVAQGNTPQVPDSPSSNYVAQLQAHMASPAFKKMNPVQQAMLRDHAKQVVEKAGQQLGNTPPPPPQNPQPQQGPQQPGILGRFGRAIKTTLFK